VLLPPLLLPHPLLPQLPTDTSSRFSSSNAEGPPEWDTNDANDHQEDLPGFFTQSAAHHEETAEDAKNDDTFGDIGASTAWVPTEEGKDRIAAGRKVFKMLRGIKTAEIQEEIEEIMTPIQESAAKRFALGAFKRMVAGAMWVAIVQSIIAAAS
jgi:hypothetical protein